MKGDKPKNPHKHKASSSFKPLPLMVNYSHSAGHANKPSNKKKKYYSRKEKILYYIKEYGFDSATILVSFATLLYVGWQAHISKQSMQISNRPYVGIDEVSNSSFVVSTVFGITIIIKNAGQTPAYDTYITMKIEVIPKDSSHSVPQFKKEDRLTEQYFIQAGTTKTITKEWGFIDDTIFNDIDTGRLKCFVHGTIEYNDIFGESHLTEFGFSHVPNYNITEYCEKHNNADR